MTFFTGIVLAAGKGERAGGNKLMWPLGDGVVVDAAISAQLLVCSRVRVVAGAYFKELSDHIQLRYPSVEVIQNTEWETGGMFSSVQLGLASVDTAAFIHPADVPCSVNVYQILLNNYINDSNIICIKPIFKGQGGHPILLSPNAVRVVRAANPDLSLRDVLKGLDVQTIEVDDPLATMDIDNRKQYLELKCAMNEQNKKKAQGHTGEKSSTIEIKVNGFDEKAPAGSTVLSLIERFKEGDRHLVVELNGRVLYPSRWDTVIEPNDSIEFIHPCFGG